MIAVHHWFQDPDILLALSAVMLILGVITLVSSRLASIPGWAVTAGGLVLTFMWWPE